MTCLGLHYTIFDTGGEDAKHFTLTMNHDEHKVEYIKLGDDMYQVKLSSIYDTNCADQEYLIVNGELAVIIIIMCAG